MMAGLAYMTGPPGRPLRAGSSVNDIMGGMFGVIGALAALTERERTGQRPGGAGRPVRELRASRRRSTCCNTPLTGVASPPMPDRINAWGVFDLFDTSDGEQVFLGVVTDTQWAVFGRAFDLGEHRRRSAPCQQHAARRSALLDAPGAARDHQALFGARRAGGVRARGPALRADRRPEQLFDDPHLLASGGLADLTLENGETTPVPLLPMLLDGRHLKPRMPLPKVWRAQCAAGSTRSAARCARQEMIAPMDKLDRRNA